MLFLACILSAGLSTLTELLGPQIIRMAVDNALGGQEGNYDPAVMRLVNTLGGFEYLGRNLWIMALALVLVAFLRALFQFLFRVSNSAATETLVKTIRDSCFGHIQRLPFSWHMKNHTGDIIQRCTSDLETLKDFVSEQLTGVFRIVLLLVMAAVFMFSMDTGLSLIAMLPIPVIIGYSVLFHDVIGKGFRECDENEGILSTMAQENLSGVRVVRAFGRERQELDRFTDHNEYYTGLWARLASVMSLYWSSQDVLTGIQILLVVVFGAKRCIEGSLSSGEYLAFISYNTMLAWPVRRLGKMISEMSKAGVSIERIRDIMDAEEEKDPVNALTPDMTGDIRFENVCFGYEGCRELLHNVSFTVKSGTTLGILGATGSGKSTLMLLLDKLYRLPEGNGTISVGGVDIRSIKTDWLRKNIGMVLQEPFLFSGTISENIGICCGNPSEEEIRAAAVSACLDSAIRGFDKGYDTFVGERGLTLSGGQQQRLAIARTLIQSAPIMIFDDSLSAVDTETDALIRKELEKRFGTATIIIISHRITTLAKADRILVLEEGRVAEQGTHHELYEADGLYRRICELQFGEGESIP